MVEKSRSAGAAVLLVTPASNLRDFSPFKSQHTVGISEVARTRAISLRATADELARQNQWDRALEAYDEGLALDPRFADLHYGRGRCLLALDRNEEAQAAFARARDEDICPLRALTPISSIVARTAQDLAVPLVDFVALLENRPAAGGGSGIPGDDYFVDHVHPTIEGNRLLAVAIIDTMIRNGWFQPADSWGEASIAKVASRVESGLEPEYHSRALANLATLLNWAGKEEEAVRLASRALRAGTEDSISLAILARSHARKGDLDQALPYYRRAVRANPRNPNIHFQLALLYSSQGKLEAAAAHFFLATVIWPENGDFHRHLGYVMLQRQAYPSALRSYLVAQELSPGDASLADRINWLRDRSGIAIQETTAPKIAISSYSSGAPRVFAQVLQSDSDGSITDGIWTEWTERGDLARFAEYANGVQHGIDVTWGPDGKTEAHHTFVEGVQQ